MIESFNFEYKKTKMFQDIQPAGLSVYGERGVDGKDGLSGSTVYFINYSTISDNLKTTLLNRINNSTDLNGSSATRIYHDNDLIICEIAISIYNYVYKIVKVDSTSNKYDIERFGYISSENNIIDVFDCIHSVKLNIGEYDTTECHVPVNRSYEYSSANNLSYVDGAKHNDVASTRITEYSKALRLLFGFYVAPKIKLTNESNASNYDFYIRIHIKNKKSILGRSNLPIMKGYSNAWKSNINEEPFTDNNNVNNVIFEKVIEIPVSKLYHSGTTEIPIGETKKPYFISDMACDKLHPSSNNYSSSFFDPYRNKGYITSIRDNESYPFHLFLFEYGKVNLSTDGYDYYCVGKNINGQNDTILKRILFASINDYGTDDLNSSSTLIQYSKNPNIKSSNGYCEMNYRSGESAYFSGMIYNDLFPSNCFSQDSSSYTRNISSLSCVNFNQYVAAQRSLNKNINLNEEYGDKSETLCDNRINVVKNYVCEEMKKFIFGENNVFELVSIDRRTGRTKSKILSLNQIL